MSELDAAARRVYAQQRALFIHATMPGRRPSDVPYSEVPALPPHACDRCPMRYWRAETLLWHVSEDHSTRGTTA